MIVVAAAEALSCLERASSLTVPHPHLNPFIYYGSIELKKIDGDSCFCFCFFYAEDPQSFSIVMGLNVTEGRVSCT